MRLSSNRTLASLIEQRGLSLGLLAQRSGCSKGFISHLVSGRKQSCSAELAERITAALGVPREVLFSTHDTG
jgi:transcriptional regulator with XRE-family HTH domain